MKLINAKDTKLDQSQSALPDVSGAVSDFLQPMSFGKVQKNLINGYEQEVIIPIKVLACKQSLNPAQLIMKPEGQRTWNWAKIHTLINVNLPLDSVFYIQGVRYRIMSRIDNPEYGYFEYDVVEDYSGPTQDFGRIPGA